MLTERHFATEIRSKDNSGGQVLAALQEAPVQSSAAVKLAAKVGIGLEAEQSLQTT